MRSFLGARGQAIGMKKSAKDFPEHEEIFVDVVMR
jgi:hypothetical protein